MPSRDRADEAIGTLAAARSDGDRDPSARPHRFHRPCTKGVDWIFFGRSMRVAWRIILYLWALPTTLVGLLFLIPALLTGGKVRLVDGVLEIHGGVVRAFLRHGVSGIVRVFHKNATLGSGGASAMTLGHVVLGQDEQCLDFSRDHERVHVRQCERWGPFFLPAYGFGSLIAWWRGGRAYLDNPFEREAYGSDRS